jgi:hypothetical protein
MKAKFSTISWVPKAGSGAEGAEFFPGSAGSPPKIGPFGDGDGEDWPQGLIMDS